MPEILVRTRNHLHADHFANPPGRVGAGIGRGLDRRHVAGHERRDHAAADLVPAQELDVGSLQHRIGSLEQGDEALGLDHAQRFHLLRHMNFSHAKSKETSSIS